MDGESLEAVGRETPAPGTFGSDSVFWTVTVCESTVLEAVLSMLL